MVSSKFLHDDGAEDEVFLHEWAVSGGITVAALKQLEKDFLNAMVSIYFCNCMQKYFQYISFPPGLENIYIRLQILVRV